ncbi:MAG TPA: hypothetical protein VKF42_02975 [Chitinivibrionales bacterium]|nr:hypothetical protein [Chitinivibrionales bacterium]
MEGSTSKSATYARYRCGSFTSGAAPGYPPNIIWVSASHPNADDISLNDH